MASEMDNSHCATLPDWRRDDTRNIRSNAKAERVLGVSSYNHPLPDIRIKKKASPLNFSIFSDLKDALPTLHRKASRNKIHAKASDTESMDSTPSPTFDPAASTVSLSTTHSTPLTPKREATYPSHVETLSEAETVRGNKFSMPSINEDNQLTYLAPSSEYDPEIGSPHRKGSDSSVVMFQLDDRSTPQAGVVLLSKMSQNVPPLRVAKQIQPNTNAGKHVQDWLESAQLDRRPSVLTRSSSLPVPEFNVSGLSSSSDSIQTLTSEAKDDSATKAPHWPLPSAGLPPPRKIRRIHRSNLQLESILSLSSDEDDSDGGSEWRKSSRTYKRKSHIIASRYISRSAHQRDESNASSVIQLDSRPVTRSTPSGTYRVFPKRTLADIAASAASRPLSTTSWETDLVADDSNNTEAIPAEESVLDFLASPVSPLEPETPVRHHHPLWRSSNGSSDIDIRISRPVATLHTLVEEETNDQTPNVEDELLADVNVADFPVPPRSRSGSVVPSIHVQHIEESRKDVSPAMPACPARDAILLSPSTRSRSNSTKSEHSLALKAVEQQENNGKEDHTINTIMRKRTPSNVPIYVTGLESSMTDDACEDGDVAFFVHSSIF